MAQKLSRSVDVDDLSAVHQLTPPTAVGRDIEEKAMLRSPGPGSRAAQVNRDT